MIVKEKRYNSYYEKTLLDAIKKNWRNRKIAVYGAGRNAGKVIELAKLISEEIVVFDMKCDEGVSCCGYQLNNPEMLKGKASEYYVVVSVVKEYREIREKLHAYGYNQDTDYIYFSLPVDNTPKEMYGDYSDEFGNKIIGNLNGAKVRFQGRNSIIKVGCGISAKGLVIDVNSGCEITIGERFYALTGLYFGLEDGTKLSIGDDAKWISNGCEVVVRKYGDATIGNGCEFGETNKLMVSPSTSLHIGDDALFSKFVTLRTNDGHIIYDVKSGEVINKSKERRTIVIKDHVWIGEGCLILYNTVIGNGCIVGAKSLVKGKFKNNCMIAGHIAKVIRKNVTWSYATLENGMYDLPEEYRRLTEED